jgi:hypothetical protein
VAERARRCRGIGMDGLVDILDDEPGPADAAEQGVERMGELERARFAETRPLGDRQRGG